MPSLCVFGAGAIGGLLAARLEAAGTPVSIVVRGAHRAAIESHGLTLLSDEERIVTHPRVVADPATLGPQDYVFLTLKAHSIAPALPALAPLIGPGTTISPGSTAFPGGTAPGSRRPSPTASSTPSIRRARCGGRCRRRRPSAASSIPPPRSRARA